MLALGGALALAASATPASASNTGTNTLALSAGSLSVSITSSPTFAAAASAGTLNTGLNQGTWTDATGLGLGWNGSIALESFIFQGAWTWPSGETALTVTTSGAYTGTAAQSFIQVTVSGTPSTSSTPYTWVDNESGTQTSGSGTATNGSASTISNGMQITFNAATTYTVGAVYNVEMGVLPTTALVLHTASGSVAAGSGALGAAPVLTNNGSTVSSTSATSYGTAVKFITATALSALGSWTVTPGATITWNGNQVWAASYVANAQYTIASGP